MHQYHLRLVALVCAIGCFHLRSSSVRAVVLTFDDQPSDIDLTGSGYASITWETGNPGVSNFPGFWSVVGPPANFPNSPPRNLINAAGSTLMAFGFSTPVNMGGAYVAGQGSNHAWASSLRVHGFRAGQEVSITPWFSPITSTPTWFDMSLLTNVDRVLFESVASFQNIGIYGLDDLTFTYIPEPASLAMLTLAGAGLLARRRGVS